MRRSFSSRQRIVGLSETTETMNRVVDLSGDELMNTITRFHVSPAAAQHVHTPSAQKNMGLSQFSVIAEGQINDFTKIISKLRRKMVFVRISFVEFSISQRQTSKNPRRTHEEK